MIAVSRGVLEEVVCGHTSGPLDWLAMWRSCHFWARTERSARKLGTRANPTVPSLDTSTGAEQNFQSAYGYISSYSHPFR